MLVEEAGVFAKRHPRVDKRRARAKNTELAPGPQVASTQSSRNDINFPGWLVHRRLGAGWLFRRPMQSFWMSLPVPGTLADVGLEL